MVYSTLISFSILQENQVLDSDSLCETVPFALRSSEKLNSAPFVRICVCNTGRHIFCKRLPGDRNNIANSLNNHVVAAFDYHRVRNGSVSRRDRAYKFVRVIFVSFVVVQSLL